MRNGGTFFKGEVLVLTFIKVMVYVKSICKGDFYEWRNERILFHAIENLITGLIRVHTVDGCWKQTRVKKVKSLYSTTPVHSNNISCI